NGSCGCGTWGPPRRSACGTVSAPARRPGAGATSTRSSLRNALPLLGDSRRELFLQRPRFLKCLRAFRVSGGLEDLGHRFLAAGPLPAVVGIFREVVRQALVEVCRLPVGLLCLRQTALGEEHLALLRQRPGPGLAMDRHAVKPGCQFLRNREGLRISL